MQIPSGKTHFLVQYIHFVIWSIASSLFRIKSFQRFSILQWYLFPTKCIWLHVRHLKFMSGFLALQLHTPHSKSLPHTCWTREPIRPSQTHFGILRIIICQHGSDKAKFCKCESSKYVGQWLSSLFESAKNHGQ